MDSYTFYASARYQEKDELEDFAFNTYANSIDEAYKDIKGNADKGVEGAILWKEQKDKIEQERYSNPLYLTIQKRKHKSKRINKKAEQCVCSAFLLLSLL